MSKTCSAGAKVWRLAAAAAAAGLCISGAARAEAGASVVLGFGPPVTVYFPPPIYIPAPLPNTAAPGTVVRPINPLSPLTLTIQPPVASPVIRNNNTRERHNGDPATGRR